MSLRGRFDKGSDKTPSTDSSNKLKSSIVELDCAIKAAVGDIWKHEGPLEELQKEYEEARKKLKLLRDTIEQYQLSGRELSDLKHVSEIESSAKQFREQLLNTTSLLRNAYVEKKTSLEERNRDSLFSIDQGDELRKRRTAEANRENAARTANDLTESLLSITRVINDNVTRSGEALNTLVKSSSTIRKTDEELKDQSGVIKTGHRLLTKYSRRECTDKFLIFLALALFFSTVLYILKKRLWLHNSHQVDAPGS